ncbi:MAG TPA: alpha-E domain-containing protein, partial [Chloroflexota bacterium]|nr:alpha-E domain-containing protein [Chloroflexota bacterium]
VRFSLGAEWDALRAINERYSGTDEASSPEVRTLGLLRAHLEHAAVDEVLQEGLHAYLADVQQRIASVSDHVTRRYLRDEPPPRLVAAARAAMIMAAQQQQQQ